jgi:hypothetical protein
VAREEELLIQLKKLITMTYTATFDTATIQQWVASKLEPQSAAAELLSKGFDETTIAAYLKEYRRVRNAKKQFNGFVCMAVGAILGFVSCVLTLTNLFPELYNVILFGLTSVAILVICLGMYFLFE